MLLQLALLGPGLASVCRRVARRPLELEARELAGGARRGSIARGTYFVITPQAIRAPALPAGSVTLSSGFA